MYHHVHGNPDSHFWYRKRTVLLKVYGFVVNIEDLPHAHFTIHFKYNNVSYLYSMFSLISLNIFTGDQSRKLYMLAM